MKKFKNEEVELGLKRWAIKKVRKHKGDKGVEKEEIE